MIFSRYHGIESSDLIQATVVIVTKNESANIKQCIFSVRNFQTIVVADSNSIDSTKSLALESMEEIGKHVEILNFDWDGLYPKKKQWVLDNLKTDHNWILFMDADERMSSKLEKELFNFLEIDSKNFGAASMELEYFFGGEKLRFGYHPRKVNFINKTRCRYQELNDLWIPGYWENEMHIQPEVKGRVYRFRNRLTHNDKDSIVTWFERHCKYAYRDVLLNVASSRDQDLREFKVGRARFFQSVPAKPFFFFVYCYVFRLGFLDGIPGRNYAIAYSWYYWLQGVIKRDEVRSA